MNNKKIVYVYDLALYHAMIQIQVLKLKGGPCYDLPEIRFNPNRDPRTGRYTTGTKRIDVTKEYMKRATPGKGRLELDEGYDVKSNPKEIAFAGWLHSTLGGDIRLIKKNDDTKSPDYEWNGKLWDLKSPQKTEKAANSAVRKGIEQIKNNPGGVMLDYHLESLDLDKLHSVIDERMKWHTNFQVDIMISNNGELIEVLRYNAKKGAPPPK